MALLQKKDSFKTEIKFNGKIPNKTFELYESYGKGVAVTIETHCSWTPLFVPRAF